MSVHKTIYLTCVYAALGEARAHHPVGNPRLGSLHRYLQPVVGGHVTHRVVYQRHVRLLEDVGRSAVVRWGRIQIISMASRITLRKIKMYFKGNFENKYNTNVWVSLVSITFTALISKGMNQIGLNVV